MTNRERIMQVMQNMNDEQFYRCLNYAPYRFLCFYTGKDCTRCPVRYDEDTSCRRYNIRFLGKKNTQTDTKRINAWISKQGGI